MLRSNRKNSPIGGNGINSSTLPSYYNGHDSTSKGSHSNGHPTPVQRRKRRHGNASRGGCCCSRWSLLLIVVSCLGSYTMIHRSETAAHHFHKIHQKVRTLADPAPAPAIDSDGNQKPQRRATTRAADLAPILPPKPPSNGIYDLVVLGAGPAGLTAALFAARAGLSVLVLGSDAGSLSETHQLENFPSWWLAEGEAGGPLWLQTTKQQAAQWGATFAQGGLLVEKMQQVEDDKTFQLEISNNLQTNARAVVVATGATGRRLGLPLENELWGKSVHSCAVCDGSSYVNKVVVVVGGGDAAVDGALLLARYAKKVIMVHRRNELRASNSRNIELLKATSNIEMEMPYAIANFETSKTKKRNPATNAYEEHYVLTAVDLKHRESGAKQRIVCDGLFELIGSTPNTHWLKGSGAQLDEGGFLTLSNPSGETRTATSLEGVFAAGEATDQIYRQAITAAAEGAEAAMDAERWLRNRPAPAKRASSNRNSAIPLQTVLVQDNNNAPPEQAQDPGREREHEPNKPNPPEEDDCDLTQEECITKTVNKYPVVVFSKPWCPFCRKALEALTAEGLPEGHPNLYVVDLSLLSPKTALVQNTLQSMTGRRTVPNVFVGGSSIGGGDETSKFHREGRLQGMLVRAKAIDEDVGNEESPCDDLTREACITQLVNDYPVVVFSKPSCPHCRKALEALALEGLTKQSKSLRVIDIKSMPDMTQIQDALERMTGFRTVPNVFVGGKSIGGGSDTVQLQRSGELGAMLTKVHAT